MPRPTSALLDELEPIAEWVGGVEAAVAPELGVVDSLDAGVLAALPERVQAVHQARRIGLPGRAEVRIHADVNLDPGPAQPRPTSRLQPARLRHPPKPAHP